QLLRALLWLLAGSDAGGGGPGTKGGGGGGGTSDAREEVLEIASQLAAHQGDGDASQGQGAQDLFTRHFTDLLAYVVGGGSSEEDNGGGWSKGSRLRTGFEALLWSVPGAVGSHLGEVMPIFRELLHDPTRDPELRLNMLALLECVVRQDEVTEESMRPYAEVVLREMVLPNAVWRAGLVAATVRKMTIAVLCTSLRGNKIGVEAVYATAQQV
ncbi:unnamed protein product, partial [Hapterophycus canaliculatus]